MCRSLLWNSLRVTFVAPRIFRWLLALCTHDIMNSICCMNVKQLTKRCLYALIFLDGIRNIVLFFYSLDLRIYTPNWKLRAEYKIDRRAFKSFGMLRLSRFSNNSRRFEGSYFHRNVGKCRHIITSQMTWEILHHRCETLKSRTVQEKLNKRL
jgi:hypothetical protein